MKTLADFKRRIQIGTKLVATYPSGLELPAREVVIKQSNSFALKTVKKTGEVIESWMEYPKASMIEFPTANQATIFWESRSFGRTECLTYTFVE
tara:strand:- start:192 stop:473 length:282 start_codon:yes stop_codon:yes gene_type:complete